MSETDKKPDILYLETFSSLPDEEKYKIFSQFPRSAQKLLIGGSTFTAGAMPSMLLPVSELEAEEFETTKKALLQTPFFIEKIIDLAGKPATRLEVVKPMRDFINGWLTNKWREQNKKD